MKRLLLPLLALTVTSCVLTPAAASAPAEGLARDASRPPLVEPLQLPAVDVDHLLERLDGAESLKSRTPGYAARLRAPTMVGLLGVAPLTVTLATEHACPAPVAQRRVLDLQRGCPAPWSGRLYTLQADQSVRDEIAALDDVCDALSVELEACRVVRSQRAGEVVAANAQCATEHDAVATTIEASPPLPEPSTTSRDDRSPAWPWAFGAVSAGAGGGLVARLSGGSEGAVLASAAGAAAAGVGFAAFMDWIGG